MSPGGMDLTAEQVARMTGGRLSLPAGVRPEQVRVTGPVVVDSRLAEPGALFVALPGAHVDGHDFAAAAARSGAVLVLATREVRAPAVVVRDTQDALGALARAVLAEIRRPGRPLVVGVTGSVGKTTTKDLLGQVLGADGPTVAPQGSFNNEIGLPLTVLRADVDTRFLVLEMGASGLGHLTYLTSIAPPDVAIVLAVGAAHLGEFGGIEAVAQAKSELVTGLAPGGVAVLNADDPRVRTMADLAPGPVLTFGRGADADVRALDERVDDAGRTAFRLRTPRGEAEVRLRLVGAHHVANALATAAVGHHVGVGAADLAARLSAARALSPHRMQVVERPDGVRILDDAYNANPDSMRAALTALTSMRRRRAVAVLGEMLELGPDSVPEHAALGRLAAGSGVDLLVVVGEGARAVHDAAERERSWTGRSVWVPDLAAAEQLLAAELASGDVVLVKSSHGAGLWRLADALTGAGAPADARAARTGEPR